MGPAAIEMASGLAILHIKFVAGGGGINRRRHRKILQLLLPEEIKIEPEEVWGGGRPWTTGGVGTPVAPENLKTLKVLKKNKFKGAFSPEKKRREKHFRGVWRLDWSLEEGSFETS